MSTLMQGLNINMLNLLSYGSRFLKEVEGEVERRWAREQQINEQGTCFTEEAQHKLRVRQFNSRVTLASQEIRHVCKSYQVGTVLILTTTTNVMMDQQYKSKHQRSLWVLNNGKCCSYQALGGLKESHLRNFVWVATRNLVGFWWWLRDQIWNRSLIAKWGVEITKLIQSQKNDLTKLL